MSEITKQFLVRSIPYTVISGFSEQFGHYHRIKIETGSQVQVIQHAELSDDILRQICETFQLGRELGASEAERPILHSDS